MIDLLDRILKYLPRYLASLLELLAKPRTFITAKAGGRRASLSDALLFLGISFVLCCMLCGAFTPIENLFLAVIKLGVVLFPMLILLLLALNLSWRWIGGNARGEQNSIIYAYQVGPVLLLLALRQIIIWGVLRPMDPSAWEQLSGASPSEIAVGVPIQAAGSSEAAALAMLVAAAANVIILLWTLVTWGAYRTTNHTSRVRSLGAFLIFTVLAIPVNYLCTALGAALAEL